MTNELLVAYSDKAGDITKFRRDVEEIVRSYRHSWDVLAELLQNAVDAIRRQKAANGDVHGGKIDIRIDSSTLKVTVTDNGCGLSKDDLLAALSPGRSFKQVGTDYGYKGFGLTFVLYASTSFSIKSVHDGKVSSLRIDSALDWLASSSTNESDLPTVTWTAEEHDTAEPNGTTISVVLGSGSYQAKFRALSALDHMFEWATRGRALEYVLRLRTAVGNAAELFGRKPDPEVAVNVTVDSRPTAQIPYKYLLASESAYVSAKFYSSVSDYLVKYEDGALSREAKFFRGLQETFADRTVGSQAPISFSAIVLVCGRTGMSKLAAEFGVTDDLAVAQELQVSTGVQLALGDMPLGISIEDWQGFGHDMGRYFVLVNADLSLSDQLDSGRKGISRYFATAMVDDLRKCLSGRTFGSGDKKVSLSRLAPMMTEPDSERSTDVTQLADRVSKRAKDPSLSRPSYLKYEPRDENEVILLFGELVATGDLPGYEFLVVSQGTTYDAAMRYALDRHHAAFSHQSSALGLGNFAITRADESDDDRYIWQDSKGTDWFIVEFKPLAQDLISNPRQQLKDIELLVCWDYDPKWLDDHAASIEEQQADRRDLYGVTHQLSYDGGSCAVIVLKKLLEQLNTTPKP